MTKFQKVEPGKYAVLVTWDNATPNWRILVKARQVMNPSARGGAYKTEWVAYNGALSIKVHGETRKAAFDKAIAALSERHTNVREVQ